MSETAALTAQVVPQGGGIVARVAGVVADALVGGQLAGDDEVERLDRQRRDEYGQQRDGDDQQDDEGRAGVDVGADQADEQTQQQHRRGVEHRVPVTLRQYPHPRQRRGVCGGRSQTDAYICLFYCYYSSSSFSYFLHFALPLRTSLWVHSVLCGL